ncbi:hypothetical protein [Ectobacillus sp. sgz5001026]|uniref:hypothetical protein n=1 Tax=Ectobacillus sp. sgz5001026 TaxID=3242473 RepID=UPI0036D3C0E3
MKKMILISLGIVTVLSVGGVYAKHYSEQQVSKVILSSAQSQHLTDTLQNHLNDVQVVEKKTEEKTDHHDVTVAPTESRSNDQNQQIEDRKQPEVNAISSKVDLEKVDQAAVTDLAKKEKVETEADAVQYVEHKLSTSEMIKTIELYNNRKQLTAEQKQTAKQDILSHFSKEEVAMLVQAVQKK